MHACIGSAEGECLCREMGRLHPIPKEIIMYTMYIQRMRKEYGKPAGRLDFMGEAHHETFLKHGWIGCRLILPSCRDLRLLQDSFPSIRSNKILPSFLFRTDALYRRHQRHAKLFSFI